jgi:HTH-type transcriptional regulator/antitoxin HigA
LPLAEVRARGWIPDTSDLDVVEDSVLHLLEINTFDERPRFAMAARRANSAEPITVEQTAWLAHVRSVAAGRDADRFDRTRLAALAEHLPRALRDGPGNLLEVPSLLATCGVVVVFSEGLRGGKLDGAVTLLGDDRPVIGLTTRGDRFDGVLFTLLHECAHLVLDHITSNEAAIVDADVMDEQTDPPEKTANEQAMQWLFPDGFQVDSASVPAIVAAADRYQVHPSVVIGQIQRQTGDWKKYRARVPKVRSFLAQSGALS